MLTFSECIDHLQCLSLCLHLYHNGYMEISLVIHTIILLSIIPVWFLKNQKKAMTASLLMVFIAYICVILGYGLDRASKRYYFERR